MDLITLSSESNKDSLCSLKSPTKQVGGVVDDNLPLAGIFMDDTLIRKFDNILRNTRIMLGGKISIKKESPTGTKTETKTETKTRTETETDRDSDDLDDSEDSIIDISSDSLSSISFGQQGGKKTKRPVKVDIVKQKKYNVGQRENVKRSR